MGDGLGRTGGRVGDVVEGVDQATDDVVDGWRRHGPDLAFLALAPVAVFFVLRVRAMAVPTMIDPSFYTAYATNPRPLIVRYGPGNYFWVRLGAIVPSLVGARLFGPVPGFYVVRYGFALLATVPVHLLFLRHHGRAAARLAVLVVLTCPVLLTAWGTDYPDAAAVSYLAGGTACLLLDRDATHRRWWIAGSVAMALAVHSQAGAASLAVVALAVALWWCARTVRDLVVRSALAVASVAVTTGGVVAVARLVFLNADVFQPTLDQVRVLRQQADIWHTSGLGWITSVSYLLVPVLVVGAGAAVVALGPATERAWRRPGLATVLVALAAIQSAAQFVLQAAFEQSTLEFHLYSSMLWPSVLLALAAVLVAVAGDGPRRAQLLLGLTVVVVAVPVAVGVLPRLGALPWVGAGLVLVVLAVVATVAVTSERSPAAAWPGARLAGGLVVVAAACALTVAPVPPRASTLPHGRYDQVLHRDGSATVATYRAATELAPFVEQHVAPSDGLLLWWVPDQTERLNPPAAQYLWSLNALAADLPALTADDVRLVAARRPSHLLLLGVVDDELAAGVAALEAAGFAPEVVARDHLGSGAAAYVAWVVRIDPDRGRPVG